MPAAKSVARLKDTVRQMTGRKVGRSVDDVVRWLNPRTDPFAVEELRPDLPEAPSTRGVGPERETRDGAERSVVASSRVGIACRPPEPLLRLAWPHHAGRVTSTIRTAVYVTRMHGGVGGSGGDHPPPYPDPLDLVVPHTD
jgi:hypothetical protein